MKDKKTRAARRGRPELPPKMKAGDSIAIRVTDAQKLAYEARAAVAGMMLGRWIKSVLDRECVGKL